MTMPMFNVLGSGRPRMPRQLPATTVSAPAWSKYTPARPVRCDLCMRLLAETNGTGPLPKDARWKRRTAGEMTLLCHGHAHEQRHADRMPPLPGPKP